MTPTIRSAQLAAIRATATAPHEGSLLIVGEPGSGKSHLLAAVEPIPGRVLYHLRINPAESEIPLSGLSAMVASFQNPDAAALSSRLLAPTNGADQMAARAAELLSLIHDLAPSSAVLLIDDLDLMDVASQTIFAMVATRLGGTGLCLVGTLSSEPIGGALGSLPRLTLERLNFSDSMALVTGVIGTPSDDAVRCMVVSASSGSPRDLVSNARLLTNQQLASNAPVSLPFRVARTPLPPVVPPTGPQALLARLSSSYLSSQDAILSGGGHDRGQLEELLSAGTVVRDGRYLRLGDAARRARLYWALDAGTRAELHMRAASAEAEPGGDPGLAAWHLSWADAGRLSSDDLLAAATAFAARGLTWQAIELAERALTLALDSTGNSDALSDLAHALYRQGELSFATRYARLGQRRPGTPRTTSRLAILRTQIEFMTNQQLASGNLDDWVTGRSDSPEARDGLAYTLGVIAACRAERWEVEGAREALGRSRHLLPGAAPETIELHELSTMLLAALEGDSGPADRALERHSRQGWARATPPLTLLTLGRSLMYVDRHGDARRLLNSVLNLEPPADQILQHTARYYLAENEIMAGNQSEAVAIIHRLHITGAGTQLHHNLHQLLMSWYWQANGDRAKADKAIDACHLSFGISDNPALTARLLATQGRFALMEGRFEDAILLLRNVASLGAAFRNPALLRYQADLIEAYVLSGRLRDAVAQYREFQARARQYRTRWTLLALARVEALLTPGEASLTVFEQAVKAWQPGDPQFELGRTLLSFADRLLSLGHSRESTEQYLAARMVFTQLGAVSWARKADPERLGRPSPSRHPLLEKLAPEERLVVELVRQGLRNKEIAAELFISLRTVEVRLTRTYNKLGAPSRSHLIAMLSESESESDPAAVRAAGK